MKNAVIISFSYIAAIIGAGFASGAEIVSYFLKYGKISVLGVLLSAVLFGCLSYLVLRICVREDITDFRDFLNFVMPKKAVGFSNIAVNLFMVITLSAMSSGASEIFNVLFGMNKLLGAVVFSAGCGLILMMSVKKITCINGALGIIIAIGVVLACLYIINFRFYETVPTGAGFLVSSAVYTSYNGASAIVLLCKMSSMLKTRKQVGIVGVISGVGIFLILLFLWCVVELYYGKVELGTMPMLTIARRQNNIFSGFYSIILFLAVLTTAISNGFGVTQFLKKGISGIWAVIITVFLMVILSSVGFGMIVDIGYRLCGLILIIIPLFIVRKEVISRKTMKNRENK